MPEKHLVNLELFLFLFLTIFCEVFSRECSDRDYSVSISNFVKCVQNNFEALSGDDYDQSKLKPFSASAKPFWKFMIIIQKHPNFLNVMQPKYYFFPLFYTCCNRGIVMLEEDNIFTFNSHYKIAKFLLMHIG